MYDIINFNYINFILDVESLTNRKIKQAIEKKISNKISDFNDVSNEMIRSAMRITNEQIRSLFKRCLRDEIQSIYFKRIVIILLRKSNNKDYTRSKLYKSITLLNTLSKILKIIILEYIRYVVVTYAILSII